MKKIALSLVVVLLAFVSSSSIYAQSAKSPLKILFVGYDPAGEVPVFQAGRLGPGGMSEVAFRAELPVRESRTHLHQ